MPPGLQIHSQRQTDRQMINQDPLLNEHGCPEAEWTDCQLAQMMDNKNAMKVLRKWWTN